MALRDFDEISYLPILSLRPAEMRALEELPNRTKDLLLPLIHLRPWGAAYQLQKALDRITQAYGDRPLLVGVGYPEVGKARRPVHDSLDILRSSRGGYKNWCDFVEENDNFIPAVQLGSAVEESEQFRCLHALGRGMAIVIEEPGFGAIRPLARRVAAETNGGEDVCFILDYLRVSRDHLQRAAATATLIQTISAAAPSAHISVSASSFPDNFVNVPDQPIYERRLFDAVAQGTDQRIIYSDRGSARVERQQGGGGAPSPRIDYPLQRDWKFYRADTAVGFSGYRQEARRLMNDEDVWNPNLHVWGTQMIRRTVAGDASAISNPGRSTAARINIHLQVQCYYDDPGAAEDTDEEWEG